MEAEKKKQGKKCFIITPIGNENSDIFRKAKGVIESVIKPILEKYSFDDVKPAYEILESGMINNQIINRIINDDLVVVNLTGNNPNVMYELAIRHATAKPIIHICENGTMLPFDIKDNRTIFYTDDMLGVQELNKGFENFVANISYSNEYRDNPIYNAVQTNILLHKMDSEGRGEDAYLLQKILDELSSLKVKTDDTVIGHESIDNKFHNVLVYIYNTNKAKLEKIISADKTMIIKVIENDDDGVVVKISNYLPYSKSKFLYLIHSIMGDCGIVNYRIEEK